MRWHSCYVCPIEELSQAIDRRGSSEGAIAELRSQRWSPATIARALCVVLDIDVVDAHARVPDALVPDDELDRDDVAETFAVEEAVARLRQTDGEAWFIARLERALGPEDHEDLMLLSVVADRCRCPVGLVASLLRAARVLDASLCRAPIETVFRHHGVDPIEDEIGAIDRAGDERAVELASTWRYWLRALEIDRHRTPDT